MKLNQLLSIIGWSLPSLCAIGVWATVGMTTNGAAGSLATGVLGAGYVALMQILAYIVLAVFICLALTAIIALYLLPSIIAYKRHHRNGTAILVVDLLLGWMLVGWVAALVWALYEERRESIEACGIPPAL